MTFLFADSKAKVQVLWNALVGMWNVENLKEFRCSDALTLSLMHEVDYELMFCFTSGCRCAVPEEALVVERREKKLDSVLLSSLPISFTRRSTWQSKSRPETSRAVAECKPHTRKTLGL